MQAAQGFQEATDLSDGVLLHQVKHALSNTSPCFKPTVAIWRSFEVAENISCEQIKPDLQIATDQPLQTQA